VRIVFVLFVTVLIIDIYLMVNVSTFTSAGLVALWLFFSGFFGIYLIRWQGLRTIEVVRQTIVKSQVPKNAIFTGVLVFCSGLLLIVPGLITDLFGLSLLTPRIQYIFLGLMQQNSGLAGTSFSEGNSNNNSFSSGSCNCSQIIEGELADDDEKLN
tara:strand:- start:4454 stop:4921 length:468 start_codon:yes stop_codon:yes gene_type:complete